MERGTSVGWFALATAIVAVGLGIAALVLALDEDDPVFPFGAAGFRQAQPGFGQVRPALPDGPPDRIAPREATPGQRRPEPDGDRARPQLGVQIQETDDGLAVTGVTPGSAAEEAGLIRGDVITSIGGDTVGSVREAVAAIGEHEVGDTVELGFERDGESRVAEVKLGDAAAGARRELPFGLDELPFDLDGFNFEGFDFADLFERLEAFGRNFEGRFEGFGGGFGNDFSSVQIVTGELLRVDDDEIVIDGRDGPQSFALTEETLILGDTDALVPGQSVFVVATDGVARVVRPTPRSGDSEDEASFVG